MLGTKWELGGWEHREWSGAWPKTWEVLQGLDQHIPVSLPAEDNGEQHREWSGAWPKNWEVLAASYHKGHHSLLVQVYSPGLARPVAQVCREVCTVQALSVCLLAALESTPKPPLAITQQFTVGNVPR